MAEGELKLVDTMLEAKVYVCDFLSNIPFEYLELQADCRQVGRA